MMQHFSNYLTFQNVFHLPPPPPPPPQTFSELSDEEFVKSFESRIEIQEKKKMPINCQSICKIKYSLGSLVASLRDIQSQEMMLVGDQDFSDDEWMSALEKIEMNKKVIESTIKKFSDTFIELSRKLLAKRQAKRRRQKRQRLEYKEEKTKLMKEREERSRKIDESLQKAKEDLERAKKQEEAKRQADIVLKEVIRKKQDAKKTIAKLESLLKLRLTRQNTAKGKGQSVSEQETVTFEGKIEKLKTLWIYKLSTYEVEEAQLREKLDVGTDKGNSMSTDMERQAVDNLVEWRKALFGSQINPQVDFNGDIGKFIAVRSQWDQFIDNGVEASPIPTVWVVPTTLNNHA